MNTLFRLAGLALMVLCVAATAAAADAAQTPAQAYAQFHKSLRHSFSERTVLPYFSTHAREEFDRKFPPQFRGKAIYLMKTASPEKYRVVDTKLDGDTAVLKLSASDSGKVLSGTVDLQKENGAWKIDNVVWQGR